jgi:hypothetical protein
MEKDETAVKKSERMKRASLLSRSVKFGQKSCGMFYNNVYGRNLFHTIIS